MSIVVLKLNLKLKKKKKRPLLQEGRLFLFTHQRHTEEWTS